MPKPLLVLLICTCAFAAPATDGVTETIPVELKSTTEIVEILESGNEHHADGSYSFHYRGEDGTFREETAVVKNPGTKDEYLEVSGSYSFLDTDGKEIVVNYTADQHGFVPEGNNIPHSISAAAKEASDHAYTIKQAEEKEEKE